MCSVWTENYRNRPEYFYFVYRIGKTELIRYICVSSEDFRAFSEYLEDLEASPLVKCAFNTTLSYVKLCLAHGEEVCTMSNSLSH